MWAYQNTFVDPDIAFVEVRTIDAVMGTMLGGVGTVLGPVVGGGVLYWLREVLWANFLDFHLIVQGVLLGFIVLYLPKGLMGLFRADSALGRRLDRDQGQRSSFDGMTSAFDESSEDDTAERGPSGDEHLTEGVTR